MPTRGEDQMSSRIAIAVLASLLSLVHAVPCAADDDDRHPRGKAPLEVVVDHLHDPAGLAIAPDGTLLVVADAWRPAYGPKQKGVLLRWNASSAPTVLASGFRNPQQIALGAEGIAVSTRKGLRDTGAGSRSDNDKDDDDQDDDDAR